MNKYNLTLILKPELEEKERKEFLDALTKKFGKLEKEELWGIKNLAYPVKKQIKGYFAHYFFESEPQNISSLDKSLKINEDILRYLMVRA